MTVCARTNGFAWIGLIVAIGIFATPVAFCRLSSNGLVSGSVFYDRQRVLVACTLRGIASLLVGSTISELPALGTRWRDLAVVSSF